MLHSSKHNKIKYLEEKSAWNFNKTDTYKYWLRIHIDTYMYKKRQKVYI